MGTSLNEEDMIAGNYKIVNLELLYEIAEEDEFIIEILSSYVATAPHNVELLITALKDNNVADIKFAAHKLKGSFRFIGATKLGDIMEQIELKYDGNEVVDTELIEEIADLSSETLLEVQDILNKLTP